jgi:phosphoglycerate-specific signal transduction histidine kinase
MVKNFDIGIGAGLIASFLTMILIPSFIGAVGWYSFEKVNKIINEITSIVAPTIGASEKLIARMAEFNSIA